MISKFWLSNKEPCPCGSGKIYGDCCKRKPQKVFHNEKKKNNIFNNCIHNANIFCWLSKNKHKVSRKN